MEGYPYPLLVEGDWSSINAETLQRKMQIYFQSKKKSQGGDCVVRWSERGCTVHFKAEEIRDQVLSKAEHEVNIDKQVVKLKVSKPGSGTDTDEKPQGSAEAESDVSTEALQPACSVREDNVPVDSITKDILELFEKWGGPVEKISTNPEERSVIITFRSLDAVKKIVAKTDHILSGQPITIRPFSGIDVNQTETGEGLEDAPWSSAVLLENLPENTNKDYLMLLVESVCGDSEEYSLELIPKSNTAVVTFNDPNTVEKFLMECKTKRKFQEDGLMVQRLGKCRHIKVENLPPKCTDDFLELYLEKYVGAVERLTLIPDEHAAIATLPDQRAVQTVLGKQHSIYKTPITIYPYYPSLGSALYGKDRPNMDTTKAFYR